MTTREFLLEFLKFHYKQNQFRKQETNEKDVDDFIAEFPVGFEIKNLSSNNMLSDSSNRCEECSKKFESGTVFCSADCRRHYYSN